MEKWVLVDDRISKAAVCYHTPFETKEEAVAAANAEWNHMTEYDQKRTDAFFVGLYDWEDGDVVGDPYETIEEWM